MPMPLPIAPSAPNRATSAPSVGHDQRGGGVATAGVVRGGAAERFGGAAVPGRDEAGGAVRGVVDDAELDGRGVLARAGVDCLLGAEARGGGAGAAAT